MMDFCIGMLAAVTVTIVSLFALACTLAIIVGPMVAAVGAKDPRYLWLYVLHLVFISYEEYKVRL